MKSFIIILQVKSETNVKIVAKTWKKRSSGIRDFIRCQIAYDSDCTKILIRSRRTPKPVCPDDCVIGEIWMKYRIYA